MKKEEKKDNLGLGFVGSVPCNVKNPTSFSHLIGSQRPVSFLSNMTTPMKTTTNNDKAREPIDDDATTNLLFSNRVCCFCFPCFGRSDRSAPGVGTRSECWEGVRTAEIEDRWWRKGWTTVMKAREWSEIVAGPKWKTFIRRFGKRGGGRGQGKFQYDPLSYAMNFDEGQWQNGNSESEHGARDFSARFVSAKSTVVISETSPPLLAAAVDS